MSSSMRRFKERGGGGGKVMAEVPLPPSLSRTRRISSEYSSSKENLPYAKPAGKPISGGGSRTSKDSGVRSISRKTAKSGAANGDAGRGSDKSVRWSTSALPKSKPSSDLSDFARFLSGLRRERIVRASKGKELPVGTDLVKKALQESSSADTRKDSSSLLHVEGAKSGLLISSKGEKCGDVSDLDLKNRGDGDDLLLKGSLVKENQLRDSYRCSHDLYDGRMSSREPGSLDNGSASAFVNGREDADFGNFMSSNRSKSDFEIVFLNNDSSRDSDKDLKTSCTDHVVRENDHLQGRECSEVIHEPAEPSSVKYPSKIREKLASLEGRVKSIASEIKRTKEMLDTNNSDGSEYLLLDIQGKISGIEKAMGCIIEEKGKLGLPKVGILMEKNEPVTEKNTTICENPSKDKNITMVTSTTKEIIDEQVRNQSKPSIKCLSSEEMEARLFPHHKLLWSRPPLVNTTLPYSFVTQNSSCSLTTASYSEQGDGKLSPVDENPIELEFLASLKQTSVPQLHENVKIPKIGDSSIQEMFSVNANQPCSDVEDLDKQGVEGKNDLELSCDEKIQFTDQENSSVLVSEGYEDSCENQLIEIGMKTATGGWFASEGESALLAHADGSCSFNDLVHCEGKSLYVPPGQVPTNLWGDIWLIRAAGSDGCARKYVVAASAGNALDSGFCSWDFYTRKVQAFQTEGKSSAVASSQNRGTQRRRNALSAIVSPENRHWWYKPCGPLITSTAIAHKSVSLYDIRDGDLVMKWETQTPVAPVNFSSPLQWRNKEKVVIAETDAISMWDVSSLVPRTLSRVSCVGKRVSAFHIHNTDAEFGGGIRQRVSSSETEGNDGVYCTSENLNIFDFRVPSGVGLKIPKPGVNGQSVFARGDAIFLGAVNGRLTVKGHGSPMVQHFSLRKGRMMSTYSLPDASHDFQHSSLTQVWGSSELVMAASDRGLFVFDTCKDEGMQSVHNGFATVANAREVIGPDNLCCPSFDYAASRVLLISRDRPACWRFLS